MRIIFSILSVVFPALVLLLYDNLPGALIALVLQATVIGWIPAAIWAWRVVHDEPRKKKTKVEDIKE